MLLNSLLPQPQLLWTKPITRLDMLKCRYDCEGNRTEPTFKCTDNRSLCRVYKACPLGCRWIIQRFMMALPEWSEHWPADQQRIWFLVALKSWDTFCPGVTNVGEVCPETWRWQLHLLTTFVMST